MLLSALVLSVLGSLASAENVAPKGARQSHETLRHTKGPFVIVTTHVSETLDITGCVDDAKYSAIELHTAKSIKSIRKFWKYTDCVLLHNQMEVNRNLRRLAHGHGQMIMVNNGPEPHPSVRDWAAREKILFAQNNDSNIGWGYELGAWRWAVQNILTQFDFDKRVLIYFIQDSVIIKSFDHSFVTPCFSASCFFDFPAEIEPSLNNQTWLESFGVDYTTFHMAMVSERMRACGGPNFVATYEGLCQLIMYGLWDKIRVNSKLLEQATERAIGWVLYEQFGVNRSIQRVMPYEWDQARWFFKYQPRRAGTYPAF